MNVQNKWNQLTSMVFTVSLIALTFTLQGCGSGGSSSTPPPPPPAPSLATAARGYYAGTGTITTPATNSSFQAMADRDKLVIVDQMNLIFYNITFTEVTAATFKASVRVYKDGDFIRTTSINNGTIASGSLKGSFVDTGAYANGTFDLTYDATINARAPAVYGTGAANVWEDSTPARTGAVLFNTTLNISILPALNSIPSGLSGCEALDFDVANIDNEQPGRLRRFTSNGLTGCGTAGSLGKQLSGFFTNFDGGGGMDDRLLLITFNDDLVYTGILPCFSGTCF